MANQPVNGSWKNYVLAILTTMLLTSTTGWFAFGRDAVRKDELMPLQITIERLANTVSALSTEVAVLNTKLESLRQR